MSIFNCRVHFARYVPQWKVMMQSLAPVYRNSKDLADGKEKIQTIMKKFKDVGITDQRGTCLIRQRRMGAPKGRVGGITCCQSSCRSVTYTDDRTSITLKYVTLYVCFVSELFAMGPAQFS